MLAAGGMADIYIFMVLALQAHWLHVQQYNQIRESKLPIVVFSSGGMVDKMIWRGGIYISYIDLTHKTFATMVAISDKSNLLF